MLTVQTNNESARLSNNEYTHEQASIVQHIRECYNNYEILGIKNNSSRYVHTY